MFECTWLVVIKHHFRIISNSTNVCCSCWLNKSHGWCISDTVCALCAATPPLDFAILFKSLYHGDSGLQRCATVLSGCFWTYWRIVLPLCLGQAGCKVDLLDFLTFGDDGTAFLWYMGKLITHWLHRRSESLTHCSRNPQVLHCT